MWGTYYNIPKAIYLRGAVTLKGLRFRVEGLGFRALDPKPLTP